MSFLNIVHDRRVDCYSALTVMTTSEYLEIIRNVYDSRGGIEGQRGPLKTKTALSIRARMVQDLEAGAVIPPLVIGIHGTPEQTQRLRESQNQVDLIALVQQIESDRISIIDGMQRTTALIEAARQSPEILNNELRVEFWISESLNSLIYRMLVLNTGQVPWEVARQLETIYSQLLKIIRAEVGDDVEIFGRDDARRRSEPGQYHASSIVRLFLAFSSRRAEMDLKYKVAEDFARLDAIEASSHKEFLSLFICALRMAVSLDRSFSRAPALNQAAPVRIADGRELFQAFPALIGFFVAVAIKLFDQPGFEIPWSRTDEVIRRLQAAVNGLTNRLDAMSPEQVDEFLQLDLLNDRLSQRSGQVGRFERDLFVRAFSSLLDNADRLTDMTPCWRA